MAKKFTWVISNFSSLPSEAIYSDHFIVGGCKWRLKAYPRGLITYDEFLLFLQVNDPESLLPEWRRLARFSVTIVNQNPKKSFKVDDRQSWFDKCSFRCSQPVVPLSEFKPKDGGFLVNDELKIVAEVEVLEVVGKLDVTEEPVAEPRPLKKTKLNVPQAATPPLKKIKVDNDGAVSRDLLKETVDVNGFQVLPSQVDAVRRIFEKHPDIALGFRAKNQHLRTVCVNVLLSLTEILRQLPQEISKDDLAYAYVLLGSLKDAGLKVDWLEKKVNEVSEKKEKERACETRMLEIKKELEDLKAEVSDARAPLTLDDVV